MEHINLTQYNDVNMIGCLPDALARHLSCEDGFVLVACAGGVLRSGAIKRMLDLQSIPTANPKRFIGYPLIDSSALNEGRYRVEDGSMKFLDLDSIGSFKFFLKPKPVANFKSMVVCYSAAEREMQRVMGEIVPAWCAMYGNVMSKLITLHVNEYTTRNL